MHKNGKKSQGVITVLVALMLAGILSVGTLALEAGRLQAAKTQMNDANISAGTSMIASYNSDLYDRYGLLAIDSDSFTTGRYRNYLDFNSDLFGSYKGNNLSTLYKLETVELEGFYNLTYPSVLKRQLLSRAKYNIVPQNFALNYYNMNYFLLDLQNKAVYVSDALESAAMGYASPGSAADISAEMQEALKILYAVFQDIKKFDSAYDVTLNSSTVAILPSQTGPIETIIPTEDLTAINNAVSDAQTVLGSNGSMLVSNGAPTYSEVDVAFNGNFISELLSKLSTLENISANAKTVAAECRAMLQGINAAMNMLSADKEGNLLLNSYIAEYFSNKNYLANGYRGPAAGTAIAGTMDNATFASACTEYVFSGNASETANQQCAYDYIMAVRLVNNLYSVINASNSFNGNNICSVAAHIAWAYYETFVDTELLVKYGAVVPFAKYNMILPVNEPSVVTAAFASKDFLQAMKALNILREEPDENGEMKNTFVVEGSDQTNYRDALALALWFVPNSKKMMRVADLVQLEMRYREQYIKHTSVNFLMSEQNTFCRVKCVGQLNSILPVISFGGNGKVKGNRFQSIKYVGY